MTLTGSETVTNSGGQCYYNVSIHLWGRHNFCLKSSESLGLGCQVFLFCFSLMNNNNNKIKKISSLQGSEHAFQNWRVLFQGIWRCEEGRIYSRRKEASGWNSYENHEAQRVCKTTTWPASLVNSVNWMGRGSQWWDRHWRLKDRGISWCGMTIPLWQTMATLSLLMRKGHLRAAGNKQSQTIMTQQVQQARSQSNEKQVATMRTVLFMGKRRDSWWEVSGTNADGGSIHQFPKDRNLSRKWTSFVHHKRDPKTWTPGTGHVCSTHFSTNDYVGYAAKITGFSLKLVLKKETVPPINPVPTPDQLATAWSASADKQKAASTGITGDAHSTDCVTPTRRSRAVSKLTSQQVSTLHTTFNHLSYGIFITVPPDCTVLPYLTLPCLASPCVALLRFALSFLALPWLGLSWLVLKGLPFLSVFLAVRIYLRQPLIERISLFVLLFCW